MSKPYRLIPEELPEIQKIIKGSMYDELLDDFLKSKSKTCRVEYAGKNSKNLMSGIRARIKKRKLDIKLAIRSGQLYLVKL
ncbi:MAG: hypothetical protein QXI32_03370 [Candidatus Bathyarchaeia archaeon]